jgi:regulation of enolase protein 1 (concanavalin A-like superfamily)
MFKEEYEMLRKNFFPAFLCLLAAMLIVVQIVSAAELTSIDIGDAANTPGETKLENGKYTITGSGNDIWGTADGCRFVYMELGGDFVASVQITYFERYKQWTKAGIMARQSNDPGSKNVLSTAAAGNVPGPDLGVQITWRQETNGETQELDYWELGGPTGFNDGEWIRLTRLGNDFSASWSLDGNDWVDDYATVTVEMTDPILVGLTVVSLDTGYASKAVFENLKITRPDGTSLFPSAVHPGYKIATSWGFLKSR